jgi:sulfide:quinone oxidoreductase
MKQLVILGAGTGGTMMANHLNKKLDKREWQIHIIDERETHYYQPGYLFLPFDIYTPEDIVKPIRDFIPRSVRLIIEKIERIDAEEHVVRLVNGNLLRYDVLIIATGARIAPEEVEGMSGEQWQKSVFDFYSLKARWHYAISFAYGKEASWSCTLRRCRSNVRWPHWNLPFWPIPILSKKRCGTK